MEIEIKVKVKEFANILKKLESLGYRYCGKKHQIDTYYSLYKRPLKKRKGQVLRIRYDKLSRKTRLEFHVPKNDMAATEYEVEVGDLKTMVKILTLMKAKKEFVIEKQRRVYKKGQLEVALDKVKGLGNFVEVEMEGHDTLKNRNAVKALHNKLGISSEQLLTGQHYNILKLQRLKLKYAYF